MSPPPERRSSDAGGFELPAGISLELAHVLWGFDARLRDLARGLGELRDEYHDLAGKVGTVTRGEEIAAAVTTALENDRRAHFTMGKKLLGGFAAALLVVPAIHDAVSWLLG